MDNITISITQKSDGSDDRSCDKATLLHDNHALNFQFLREGSLLDRTQQIDSLMEVLHRRLRPDSTPEMVLIAGFAGTGKTALARKLREPTKEKGGFFIMGKFDQLTQSQPFAPLVAALTEFVRLVLKQSNEIVDIIASRIVSEVGNDIGILSALVPAIKEIVGRPPEGSLFILKSVDAEERLKGIFVRFIRAACSPSCPLVFVMDDLQWADAGSLGLLEAIISDQDNHAVVVVGTCRSNEVHYTHDLSVLLRRLEDDKKASICTVEVGCLSIQATNSMIASALRSPENDCFGVTNSIYSKTKGNVFFTVEFLKALFADNVLKKDPNTRSWLWDDEVWAGKFEHFDTILHLFVSKLQKLSDECQTLLVYAACLGTELDEELLCRIFFESLAIAADDTSHLPQVAGLPVSQVNFDRAIEKSVLEGIILKESHSSSYRFCHDLVKEAAYNLVSHSELSWLHFSLGNYLYGALTRDELDEYIFVVADQMSLGMECIKGEVERTRLASLCLLAGKKAISSSDYKTSSIFLKRGIDLLDFRRSWRDEYHLTLDLFNSIAQASFRLGDFAASDKAISVVITNARSCHDKINCLMLQMYSYEVRQRIKDAIELGLDVLQQLGEEIPKNAGNQHIVVETCKIKRILRKTSDAEITGVPDMTDQTKLSAMGVLNLLFTTSFIGMPKLFPLVAMKLFNLTLNHGASAVSSIACVGVGVLMANSGDIDAGYRMGQLALMFVGRYNSVRNDWIPRVYVWHYGLIALPKEQIGSALDRLAIGAKVAHECGDVSVHFFGLSMCRCFSWYAGYSLTDLEPKMKSALKLMKEQNQTLWYETTQVSHEAMLILMDKADDPAVTDGCLLGKESGSNKLKEVLQIANLDVDDYLCGVHIHKMVVAYHSGDIDMAHEMAKRSRNARKRFGTSLVGSLQVSYDAYTCMAKLRERNISPITRHLLLRQVRGCLAYLKKNATTQRENYVHKIHLIEGEILAHRKKPAEAVEKYTLAQEEARSRGYLDVVAIACEREALTRREFGMADQAECYEKAIACYENWGAFAKAARMKKMSFEEIST